MATKKASNDDDDDVPAKSSASPKTSAAATVAAPVPSTLADWLKSLTQAAAPQVQPVAKPAVQVKSETAATKSVAKADDSKAAGKSAEGAKASATDTVKKSSAIVAGQSLGSDSLQKVTFAPTEVLAVNPSPAGLERAKVLGFNTISSDQISSLNSRVVRLTVPSGWTSPEARRLLQAELGNASVLFNNLYRPIMAATRPDDSVPADVTGAGSGGCPKDKCYAPRAVSWQSALAQCSKDLRVGVIDTAIDPNHPAFRNQSVQIGALRDADRPAESSHGTGVVALLAGQPGSSTPGLIPHARFYAADIFFADADGAPVSDTIHLLKALEWLQAWDVKIINLSLTGPKDELVEQEIIKLAAKGVIVVAAAGNDGPSAAPAYPAAYPAVIAVTAVDRNMRGYRHANQGNYIDIAAPGVDIWTALPNARQGTLTGTSLAAPFASAMIATIYESLPRKTKAAALERLRYSDLGRPGRDAVFGNGLALAPESCAPQVASGPAVASVSRSVPTGAPVVQTSATRTLSPSTGD